jgi:hypothetical protein
VAGTKQGWPAVSHRASAVLLLRELDLLQLVEARVDVTHWHLHSKKRL